MGGGSASERKEFTVLVTGMGPREDRRGGNPEDNQNSSHLITRYLPDILLRSHDLNPTKYPIRILNPTVLTGIPVEYAHMRQYIQKLWNRYEEEVDLFYHLGTAADWTHYSIERVAFNEKFTSAWMEEPEVSDGYYLVPDDLGKTVREIEGKSKGLWDDAPIGLGPTINVERVLEDTLQLMSSGCDRNSIGNQTPDRIQEVEVRKMKPNAVVKAHLEPGDFACGFLYYESLANRWRRKSGTTVLFTHVPGSREREDLLRGAGIICSIIGAVCKQIEERGKTR